VLLQQVPRHPWWGLHQFPSFFKELLEVVRRQSRLTLAVAGGLCGALHVRAACLLVDAAAVIDRGLLVALFTPLLVSLGILLGTLDCGTG
jgi:hypothetical protein